MITPPPWMVDLPPLHQHRAKAFHGIPSPAACSWVEGRPAFSIDQRKLRILALRRHCWMCGYPLNNIGYVVVTENDVTNRYGELHTAGSGPLHLSCALYAMAACPFLRYRTSRRRVTGDTHRGAASIHGFDHYGVFFPPDPRIFMLFGYYDPIETVQLTNQTHVAELYEAAVTATAATAFTIGSRLYWTDAADNLRRLNADWPKQWTTLQAWAQTSTVTIDGRTYRGRLLDNSGDLPSPKFFHHPPKRDVCGCSLRCCQCGDLLSCL